MSIIGIDFGTTKTIAAVFRDNRIEIIPDTRGRLTMPSLVLVTPEEEIFVGWEAKLHPQRYVSEHVTINSIKRVLGRERDCKWGNWKTHPQEIAALILARLKIEVEAYLGQDATDVVIAIPAHFDINQRCAVMQAAEIAGFNVRRLLNEATAAATFYVRGTDYSKEGNAIVVDIGGGTTDVSIVEYGDDIIGVKSTAGEHSIGGDDFDQLIIDHVKKLLVSQYKDLSVLSQVQEFVLRNAATTAKIELSDSSSARIYLPAFIRRDARSYDDLDLTLTREHFNKLIDPYLKRILSLIDEAQTSSGLTSKQIDTLILVGGTSRIPAIRKMISERVELPPRGNVDPDQCVAKGAAIIASVLQGNIKSLLLLDTFPSSLSVEGFGGVAHVIIDKNWTKPTRKTTTLYTTRDSPNEIEVRFFEGESMLVKNNTYIGKLVLFSNGIWPGRKGELQIEVTLDIDNNDTITASAREPCSYEEAKGVLSAPFRLNPAQVNVMRQAVSRAMKRNRIK